MVWFLKLTAVRLTQCNPQIWVLQGQHRQAILGDLVSLCPGKPVLTVTLLTTLAGFLLPECSSIMLDFTCLMRASIQLCSCLYLSERTMLGINFCAHGPAPTCMMRWLQHAWISVHGCPTEHHGSWRGPLVPQIQP